MGERLARAMPTIIFLWSVILAAVVVSSPAGRVSAAVPPASAAAQQEAGYAGSETCAVCHQDRFDDYRLSIHYQTESGPWAERGCEGCHGPGQPHADSGGDPSLIFSFTEPTHSVADKVARCLNCHERDAKNFTYRASGHMQGSIDCAACHKPHANSSQDRLLAREVPPDRLVMGAALESCLGCHQEVRADANLNERHRMLEGMVTCADCHKQHEPSARARLGGFKQETCTACHTDKSGPFVFEHLSQRVDGCTACHAPHGSVNRHMLDYQSVGDLCYSCHVEVPGFHRGFGPSTIPPRFDSTTNCVNCHTSIHGSNLDPAFLR